MEHVLSSCPVSLAEGRYTWRHNEVLKVIADTVCEEVKISAKAKGNNRKVEFIRFQKEGSLPQKAIGKASSGIINTARDWRTVADLSEQSSFPQHIVQTSQRPDVVMYSEDTKSLVMVELTVPWESRLEEAHERKRHKYEELRSDCSNSGWKCWLFPVEVGCRGFPAKSLLYMSRCLGISAAGHKRLLCRVPEVTERASNWVWTKHQQLQNINN